MKRQRTLATWITTGLLLAVTLYFLLPLLWTLRTALLPEGRAYALPPEWGPWTLENFAAMLTGPFGRAFKNSLVVAGATVLVGLPLAAMLGYAMARYRVGGAPLRFSVLATQMLPPIVLALPLFALFRAARLTNTYPGLVLAYLAFALPLMSWLLMGFFQGLPRDLEEAALVDGASFPQRFLHVTLPLLRPVIGVVLILQTIAELRTYDLVYVLTRGGPGAATDLLAYFIYRKAFLGLDLGGASALAYLLLLLTLALVVFYYRRVFAEI